MDEPKRLAISQQLYKKRVAEVGDPSQIIEGDDTEDEDLIGYDAIEPGLPPASSDRQKWWLDNKQPARAQVAAPNGKDGQQMVLNPHRPSNPFGHSDEQDWISVSRSSSRASLSSLSSSPFEKVMVPTVMSSSASSIAPRKLPPPSENGSLAAKVGRMNLANDHDARGAALPPQLPPRRQTADVTSNTQSAGGHKTGAGMPQGLPPPLRPTSTASSYTSSSATQGPGGKLPPPVGKKPAYLTNQSDSTLVGSNGSLRSLSTRSVSSSTSNPKPPIASKPALTGPVIPPGWNGSMTGPPAPPPRRTTQPQQGPVDLLDSLEDTGHDMMGGWETLQPSSNMK